ncbi:hypothetical protein BGZ65_006293 [Modicella reniformis]|uniref:SH3b domain-containing protein n=1 Tax=Modicella reniformis TaxID=1440133 RepID=A0A9P6M8E3_9FUNG|nr:hypothetical protein BGZ65_006293 [Modicella reniformis]
MKITLALAALVASIASTQAAQGTVRTAGDPLRVHSAPSVSSSVTGSLSNGAVVEIDCTATGTEVTGRFGTSTVWDHVPGGYVTDTYVYTGNDGPVAPPCNDTPNPGGNLPGLNARQSGYARSIANAAHTYGVGARGCAVAIATALVESNIAVYCNNKVQGSCSLPHDAVGSDHLSVGIFQQQSPMWGTPQQCMDPTSSAGLFYEALKGVSGWESMPIGTAAQKVQRSAFPSRYALRANEAVAICAQAY